VNPAVPGRTRVSVSPLVRVLLVASPALLSLAPRAARAEDAAGSPEGARAPQRLGVTVATTYLGSGAGSGAAVSSGLRLALGRHFALGADLGYGLLGTPSATQDRWWILPSVAWVIPAGDARIDVGAGLGLGAASGYASFGDYTRGPFSPAWAFQLVPAARVHLMAAMPLGRDVDVFARLEVAALVLSGTELGSRHGNANPDAADTTWFDLGAGVQFRWL
jgi:hypothetical protein